MVVAKIHPPPAAQAAGALIFLLKLFGLEFIGPAAAWQAGRQLRVLEHLPTGLLKLR